MLIDGLLTVNGGVDAGNNPEALPPNKISDARNVTVSGGRARSRPDFIKVTDLPTGNLQGAGFFNFSGTILTQIGGSLYNVDPSDASYEDITPDEGNNPNASRIWTCETEGSFIVQDGAARPLIFDGYKARRTEGYEEVPVGRAMAYGNGRLSVAVGLGDRVRIGDIHQPDVKGSELKFTETTFLLGGGDFSFPAPVSALFHLPVLDTATGAGSLLVSTRKSLYSLSTDITDRDMWPSINGFQSLLFPTVGVSGPEALAIVNQDVWFRANDGLRSLRMTVADYNSAGNTPMSTEVKHRLDYDAKHLLPHASLAYFDNRLLCTSVPLNYEQGAMFHTVTSLNFDSQHSLGRSGLPAYDGFWDGIKIHQFVQGEVQGSERCYFIGIDSSGQNALYEVKKESDSTYLFGDPAIVNPAKEITTRALVGQGPNGPGTLQLKRLRRADVSFSMIDGNVKADLYYRPDKFPYFIHWKTWEFSSQLDFDPDPTNAYVWDPAGHGYRMKLSTGAPPEDVHWMNDRGIDTGYSFQCKLVWTGRAQLDNLRIKMEPIPDGEPADDPGEDDNQPRPTQGDISVPIYIPDDQMFNFFFGDVVEVDGVSYLLTGDGLTLFATGDGSTFLTLGQS
jgi:hypothetical protein